MDAKHKDAAVDAHIMLAGAVIALGTLVPVALYQTGVLKRLPDPPGGIFDSEGITTSEGAHPFGVPDALLGLASYSVTLGLAIKGRHCKTARKLLGWKLGADASMAAVNVVKQVVKFEAICSWCTGTALATAVMCTAGKRYLRKVDG